MPSKRVKEIIRGLLYQNYVTLLYGEPYVGKTRFTMKMLHDLSRGSSGFWGSMDPVDILYCSERTEDELRDQLADMDVHDMCERFIMFTLGDKSKEYLDAFTSSPYHYLNQLIAEHKPLIVCLDPYTHFTPPADHNTYGDVMKAFMRLRAWCYTRKVSLLLIHHMNKTTADNRDSSKLSRALGSTGIVGSTTAAWCMEHLEGLNKHRLDYIMLTPHSHLADLTHTLYFRKSDFQQVSEEDARGEITVDDIRKAPLQTKIIALITEEAKPVAKIKAELEYVEEREIDDGTFYKAIDALERKGFIVEKDPATGWKTIRRPRRS